MRFTLALATILACADAARTKPNRVLRVQDVMKDLEYSGVDAKNGRPTFRKARKGGKSSSSGSGSGSGSAPAVSYGTGSMASCFNRGGLELESNFFLDDDDTSTSEDDSLAATLTFGTVEVAEEDCDILLEFCGTIGGVFNMYETYSLDSSWYITYAYIQEYYVAVTAGVRSATGQTYASQPAAPTLLQAFNREETFDQDDFYTDDQEESYQDQQTITVNSCAKWIVPNVPIGTYTGVLDIEMGLYNYLETTGYGQVGSDVVVFVGPHTASAKVKKTDHTFCAVM